MVKKHWSLALGVAAALASGGAVAQTAIVLYGIADGNVRFDHTSVGTLRSLGSGGESSSRWGLRGTEDLGGGLKAIFNFEQDIDLSDNSAPQGNISPVTPSSPNSSTGSRLFGRRAIVGLSSSTFGEVRFGRDYTPLYLSWVAADPFASGFVGRATNYAVGSVTRSDNALGYDSPNFYGLKAAVQYRPGESTTNNATAVTRGGEAISGSLNYAGGPVYVGLGAYANRNALNNNNVRSFSGVATYDFSVVKLHALYFNTRNKLTLRRQAYGAGVTVPIGPFRILGTVARINSHDIVAATGNRISGDDATFIGTAVTYALSKRTDVYGSWSKFKNGPAAAFLQQDASNGGLFTTTNVPAGFDPWSLQFGVRFLF